MQKRSIAPEIYATVKAEMNYENIKLLYDRIIKDYTVEEFYNFLHDEFFVWKYTAKNRLATTRMNLQKYK